MIDKNRQKEFGDYQTPLNFASSVCAYIRENIVEAPSVVFEPTCGVGTFLVASFRAFHGARQFGVEINEEYYRQAKEATLNSGTEVFNEDFFSFDFSAITGEIAEDESVLVLGNPPWVNNSVISQLDGNNLPSKSNFKGFSGIEAITGSANFDICEFILLEISSIFKDYNASMAMLCKTSVARSTYCELKRNGTGISKAKILKFDAKRIFDVSVDSCLFVVTFDKACQQNVQLEISEFSKPEITEICYSYKDGNLASSSGSVCMELDGNCELSWRQGVKHDCSKVMELNAISGSLVNGYEEPVDVEDTYVFPLLKSSSVKSYLIADSGKRVIVTQDKANGETDSIRKNAPRTWDYLQIHAEDFLKRKSTIYKNAPMFGMFGVGDYSYSPFKVGISGFYKNPRFALIAGDKPIMMDDTCYFLAFQRYTDAYVALLVLNSPLVQDFLKEIAFLDSKRPFTKKVLQRIEFTKCFEFISFDDLLDIEFNLGLNHQLTQVYIDGFIQLLSGNLEKNESPQLTLSF